MLHGGAMIYAIKRQKVSKRNSLNIFFSVDPYFILRHGSIKTISNDKELETHSSSLQLKRLSS